MKLKRSIESRLRMALILCAAILLVLLVVEMAMPGGPPPHVAPTAGSSDVSSPATPSQSAGLPPLQDYAVIWQQPLFNPDRRPYISREVTVEGDKVSAPGPQRDDEMMLTAVIVSNDLRMALVQLGGNKSVHRLAVGESLNGWQLTEVTDSGAMLQKGGEVRRLEIVLKPSPPATVARPVMQPSAPARDAEAAKSKPGAAPAAPQTPAQN